VKTRRTIRLVLAATALAIAGTLAHAGSGDAPRAVVQRMTDAALTVLRDQSASADDKRHHLEQIVYAEADFDTMSRLVLARNWSKFSPEQQTEFVREFKADLSLTYGRNIENYHNERVEVVGDQDEGRGDWTVKTKILRGGGASDILVDYRLRKENDTWKIIDIVVERVSLVSNFRSQFQEIASQGGPEKVLSMLREKNAKGEPLEGAPKPK
jgi:phospholipid transport system substrate-binding protein